MRDYSQGKIYKIECNLTNDVYYGSTTLSLSARMSLHKSRGGCSASNIIDRGNYTCKIIEEYPCNSKTELEAGERWWIENNVCINKIIPGRTRTMREWYQDNKEHNKKYRDDNKEYFQEKFTCECGGKYTRRHRLTHHRTKKHLEYISDK